MKKTIWKMGQVSFIHRIFYITATLLIAVFTLTIPGWTAGRSGFPVLQTSMDSRTLALAGSNIAETGHVNSAPVNPASAANGFREASISYARHPVDMWSGRLAVSHPVPGSLVAGVYLSIFDYGEFDRIERGGAIAGGSFNASEYVLAGYAAGPLAESLTWGASAKFAWGSISDELASGAALDLGIIWDPQWEMIQIGVVARNIGTQFKNYGEGDNPMPFELVFGGSKKLSHLPLTINMAAELMRHGDGEYTLDWLPGKTDISFGISGEFEVSKDEARNPLYFRLGYHSKGEGLRVGHRLDLLAAFSFGIGAAFRNFQFDYTYTPMGALGDVHRCGVTGRL